MTAPDAGTPPPGASRPPNRRWVCNLIALAIDLLPGAAVLAISVLVALSVPRHSGWWWVCAVTGTIGTLGTAINGLVLPLRGGESLGRAVMRPQPGRNPRRPAGVVLLTAAAVCASLGAVSYLIVCQRDRAVFDAQAQVTEQGPPMIAQLLSYRPETVQADFGRAQSLASSNYRGRLTAMQQAALQAGPTRNEYWATNTCVLSATRDRVTMLLFLQGERGMPPHQRYLTASVRAIFVAAGSSGWRVDDISLATEPRTSEANQ